MESRTSEITSDEPIPAKRQAPFKLCFVIRRETGRSYIKIGKPLKCAETVTQKFYVNDINKIHRDDVQDHVEKLKVLDPKDLYSRPMTENQRYGWYQMNLANTDRSDKRLHFGKCTNILIKEYLATLEK